MKRIIASTAMLATLTTLALTSVATANAASCSTMAVGGEKAPSVNTSTGILSETGEQGYKCTVDWQAGLFARYESGGTWHYANETNPGFHPNTPGYKQPANTGFDWPLDPSGRFITDPYWTWQPTAAGDTPVCKYNWKIEVDLFKTDGTVFQVDQSPQTNKTC